MSERKSAEIKFRCTPSFKAGLQAAADAAGESVSAYIEAAVWARENAKLDGTALVGNAIALAKEDAPPYAEGCDLVRNLETGETFRVTATDNDVPADVSVTVCSCRPWEFCTHKARS